MKKHFLWVCLPVIMVLCCAASCDRSNLTVTAERQLLGSWKLTKQGTSYNQNDDFNLGLSQSVTDPCKLMWFIRLCLLDEIRFYKDQQDLRLNAKTTPGFDVNCFWRTLQQGRMFEIYFKALDSDTEYSRKGRVVSLDDKIMKLIVPVRLEDNRTTVYVFLEYEKQ